MPPLLDSSHDELFAAAQKLYQDKQALQQDKQALQEELRLAQQQNEFLREQLNLSKKKQFGPSSEALAAAEAGQRSLLTDDMIFDEAEALADSAVPEPTLAKVRKPRIKAKGKREELLKEIPTEEIRYELPEAERVCSRCSHGLHEMSEEVRQELHFIPASAKVVNHVKVVYACRHCALHGTGTPVVTAPAPVPAFSNSLASPSSVAFIMGQKYELHLPLYRLEKYLEGLGIDLSRQTLANWVIRGADLLKPLYLKMREEMLPREILHADETPLQVLREAGRPATTKSYMWTYCTGLDGPPLVLYDYRQTRGMEHPRKFLKGFEGYLQVDGYAVYEKLPGITLVGCFAHVRRKFHEALKTLTPASRAKGSTAAHEGMAFCHRLYKIESLLRELTPEERYAARLEKSQPVMDEMLKWLQEQEPRCLPKSALGRAIAYALSQWPKLERFLKDGRLEVDNNRMERAIRPFAVGRKNWLFANTPNGATSSAIVYSMIETAKANGITPVAYLEYLFQQLPHVHPKDSQALDNLMPWTPEVQAACK